MNGTIEQGLDFPISIVFQMGIDVCDPTGYRCFGVFLSMVTVQTEALFVGYCHHPLLLAISEPSLSSPHYCRSHFINHHWLFGHRKLMDTAALDTTLTFQQFRCRVAMAMASGPRSCRKPLASMTRAGAKRSTATMDSHWLHSWGSYSGHHPC